MLLITFQTYLPLVSNFWTVNGVGLNKLEIHFFQVAEKHWNVYDETTKAIIEKLES